MAEDDAHVAPLKGAITNLNWFDAQRKHYETPDQIARRFKLPDDDAMRAFCHGAAAMLDRSTAQFVRRVPCATDDAWRFLTDTAQARQWLFGVEWELRAGGAFRFPEADPAMVDEALEADMYALRRRGRGLAPRREPASAIGIRGSESLLAARAGDRLGPRGLSSRLRETAARVLQGLTISQGILACVGLPDTT